MRDSKTVELNGKRVLVVGLGVSGHATTRALVELGAHVVATDVADDEPVRARAASLAGADVRLGDDATSVAADVDLVVTSPGGRAETAALTAASISGVPVWTEVELAYRLEPTHGRYVAITGTNGKTTTTQMTAAALTASGFHAAVAGNIGRPLIDVAREVLDVIVIELSSFQLHYVQEFRSRVAVLLNIADDHLDWHGSFERYAADKARLFANQRADDVAVYLDDQEGAR